MSAPVSLVRVWDLPVRVLHAVLAASLTVALVLGFAVGEHHPLFAYHAVAGLVAAGALVLRIVIGIVGPRSDRFARWPLSPTALAEFLGEFWRSGPPRRWSGHNPAAAWVMLAILAVAGSLIVSGLLGGGDVHEGLAVALAVLIGAHLAGLALHTLRHREMIASAMFHGRKVAEAGAATSRHGVWATGVLVALVTWAVLLGRGFDLARGQLALPGGARIDLVEREARSGERNHQDRHSHHDHDDD